MNDIFRQLCKCACQLVLSVLDLSECVLALNVVRNIISAASWPESSQPVEYFRASQRICGYEDVIFFSPLVFLPAKE